MEKSNGYEKPYVPPDLESTDGIPVAGPPPDPGLLDEFFTAASIPRIWTASPSPANGNADFGRCAAVVGGAERVNARAFLASILCGI
jgi:hypothetical protein